MAPPKPKPKAIRKPAQKSQKEKESKVNEAPLSAPDAIPLEFQQPLLNIFKNSFSNRLESDIRPLLQEVKGHLYNRDFVTAFGKEEYLEAYAARWSPSRALAYLHVLESIDREILRPFSADGAKTEDPLWRVACVGGGAGAEIMALAGIAALFTNWNDVIDEDDPERTLEVAAIDIADWTPVVDKLRDGIVTAPPISKYASASVKRANRVLLEPEQLNLTFHRHDVLDTPFSMLSPIVQKSNLVTIMFTLNELYSTSLSLTQKFLLNLTSCLRPGALLLIVDSPGSYSTVTLNGAEKKYPMHWLLDHTLLGKGGKDEGKKKDWEKVAEDNSRWFRIDGSLKYPIELENMRYQLHLYRRLG